MTVLARTKLQAIADGPFMVPSRSATIITLSKSKPNPARRWAIFGFLTLLTGAAVGESWKSIEWQLVSQFSLLMPGVSEMLRPDPEAVSGYAEIMNPPPSDVVVPVPVIPELPSTVAKVAGGSPDLSAGITLSASSLQAFGTGLTTDPSKSISPDPVAAAVAAMEGAAALQESTKPHIVVENVDAPVIGRMIEEARLMLESGDNKGALTAYNHILAHQKNNRVALSGQAFAAQRAGDYQTAVMANRHLLTLDPNNEDAQINLVAALSAWNAPPALKELQHMAETHPDFAPAQVALAHRLTGQSNVLEALPHMQHAVELEPDNIAYKLDLAVTYDKLGHSGEAVALYSEVLKRCDALDGRAPALQVSPAGIRQRVNYLEKLMASVDTIAPQQ